MARRAVAFGNLGLVLAGIWFILWGILNLPGVAIPGSGIILAILAILAGLLLIFYR
jgi:hypothetical protein